jgi:dienelactone hydrolase
VTDFVDVSLHHDGADLVGAMAVPAGAGPHPGVLVIHTALGLNGMIRERAARLARLGYAALAVDMYGGGKSYAVPEAAGGPFAELLASPGRLRARTVAWLDTLAAQPGVDPARTAALGYCFGGRCALELARAGADLRAVVSFYGLLTTQAPAEPGAVRAHVAVYAGGQDPFVPRPDLDALEHELTAAGARHTITVFSHAAHAFTDPHAAALSRPGIAYDPLADAVSWAGATALLETLFAVQ